MTTLEKILLIVLVLAGAIIVYVFTRGLLVATGSVEVGYVACSNTSIYMLVEVQVYCTGTCRILGLNLYGEDGLPVPVLWVLNDNVTVSSSQVIVYIAVPLDAKPVYVEVTTSSGKAMERVSCP